jgi:alanine racemase
MPRPILATISVGALAHNLATVRSRLEQAAVLAARQAPSLWAVIKANAYGHGIERAVRGFAAAQGLAMLDLAEAVRCREAGWQGPILLLEGIFEPADLVVVQRHALSIVVHCADQLDMLAQDTQAGARPIDTWMKLNSGMNRLGFTPHDYCTQFERARALQAAGRIGTLGKMTHFADADGAGDIDAQLALFQHTTGGLPGPVSLANSAAALRHPGAFAAAAPGAAWARPGICLYGASPFAGQPAAGFGLRPAMTLTSSIIGVQDLRPGDAVGYGGTFRADAPMRIGVVACGYADGYPRHAGTGTPITVAGMRTRTLGRVSMDMLAVDLQAIPAAGIGAPVVLWGEGGPPVDEVAAAAGTIGYELLCAVAPRVPVRAAE